MKYRTVTVGCIIHAAEYIAAERENSRKSTYKYTHKKAGSEEYTIASYMRSVYQDTYKGNMSETHARGIRLVHIKRRNE